MISLSDRSGRACPDSREDFLGNPRDFGLCGDYISSMTYCDTNSATAKRAGVASTSVETLAAALMSVCPNQDRAKEMHSKKLVKNERARQARRRSDR